MRCQRLPTVARNANGRNPAGASATYGKAAGTLLRTTCLHWTSSDSSDGTLYGSANVAYDDQWTNDFYGNCGPDSRLLCFSNREVLFWDGFDLSGNTQRWSDSVP